jgi:hypothetical protein
VSALELPLRLIVERPLTGVALAVQRGRGSAPELIPPSECTPEAASFELAVRVRAGDPPVVLGEIAQGPPSARFLYVTWGTRAGQPGSRWDRRAKVPLSGITATAVAAVTAAPGSVLEARIAGRGRDGSPACASVRLLGEGWRVQPGAS